MNLLKLTLIFLGVSINLSQVYADGTCKMAEPQVTIGPVSFDDSFAQYGLGTSYIPITIVPKTKSGVCSHAIVHNSTYPTGAIALQNMGSTVVDNSTLKASFRVYFDPKNFPKPMQFNLDFHDVDRRATGIYLDIPTKIIVP
jgi:hypothetical protein